jgi:hypothetical protein
VITAIAVYGALAMQSVLQQPCLVKRINSWSSLRFFVPAAISCAAAWLILSEDRDQALVFLATGLGAGVGVTLLFHTVRWGWSNADIVHMGEDALGHDKKHEGEKNLMFDDDELYNKQYTGGRKGFKAVVGRNKSKIMEMAGNHDIKHTIFGQRTKHT